MKANKDSRSYGEKLKDPRWQKKRLEILDRDNFCCRACSSTEKTLHVHHLRYTKHAQPWEYDERLLLTLCDECHEQMEDSRNRLLAMLTHPLEADAAIKFLSAGMLGSEEAVTRTNFLEFIDDVMSCYFLESEDYESAVSRVNGSFSVLITRLCVLRNQACQTAVKKAEECAAFRVADESKQSA